jgi:hypothetical protein
MSPTALRRLGRIMSAIVSLSALALVVAKTRGAESESSGGVSFVAACCFVLALGSLAIVWRKEHAAAREAAAARERQQLTLLELQVELSEHKAKK